jgi:hypothetical protein
MSAFSRCLCVLCQPNAHEVVTCVRDYVRSQVVCRRPTAVEDLERAGLKRIQVIYLDGRSGH